LRLLSVSSIPLAVNTIYITLKRLQMKIQPLLVIYGFIAAGTIAMSVALMGSIGIIGIGIAWLTMNSVIALTIILLVWKGIHTGTSF